MISPVASMGSGADRLGPRPRSARARAAEAGATGGWGGAARMAASRSLGFALVIWAAAVDPAEVPTIKSASATSSPASDRPAMTPTSHALPAEPPPPRTKARWLARLTGSTSRGEEGVVFKGVAFREVSGECSRRRLPQSRDRGLRGSTHCGYCVHGSHLLPMVTIAETVARPRCGRQRQRQRHRARCRMPRSI